MFNLPFDLIEAYCKATHDLAEFESNRSEIEATFARQLKEIAKTMGVNMILTSFGKKFDIKEEKIKPALSDSINLAIDHKIYLKTFKDDFQLEIQINHEGKESREYYRIPRPTEKRREDLFLADFSKLKESIDFNLPHIVKAD